MYLQGGARTPERKHHYNCGSYRNRARQASACATSHYIRKQILVELVLADLGRISRYVSENEEAFVGKALEYGIVEAKRALKLKQNELDKIISRIKWLDKVICRLYEDMAQNHISGQHFAVLQAGYDEEKGDLSSRLTILEKEIMPAAQGKFDANTHLQAVKRSANFEALTYENVREFIDKILVYEIDAAAGTRTVEIYYNFVSQHEAS